jgi:hypothetical protein
MLGRKLPSVEDGRGPSSSRGVWAGPSRGEFPSPDALVRIPVRHIGGGVNALLPAMCPST